MMTSDRSSVVGHLSELRSRPLRSAAYASLGARAAWLAYDPL